MGTLSLSVTKPWLETLAAVLQRDVPVLFTCFGAEEQKGEDFLLRQILKARVLLNFRENPYCQRWDIHLDVFSFNSSWLVEF